MSRDHPRPSAPPDLVLVGHGTRDAAGPARLEEVRSAVAEQLPGVRVRLAWVELVAPSVEAVMRQQRHPAVVLPHLLSTGHHVRTDLPRAVAAAGPPTRLGGPLGPHPWLVDALTDRLRASGARPGDPVALAAAGSSHSAGRSAVRETAATLQHRWQAPVEVAYASRPPSVATVLDRLGAARGGTGRVPVVAPYLLAPGRFAREAAGAARAAGARAADVLGAHPALVALVAARYRAEAARLGGPVGVVPARSGCARA